MQDLILFSGTRQVENHASALVFLLLIIGLLMADQQGRKFAYFEESLALKGVDYLPAAFKIVYN